MEKIVTDQLEQFRFVTSISFRIEVIMTLIERSTGELRVYLFHPYDM